MNRAARRFLAAMRDRLAMAQGAIGDLALDQAARHLAEARASAEAAEETLADLPDDGAADQLSDLQQRLEDLEIELDQAARHLAEAQEVYTAGRAETLLDEAADTLRRGRGAAELGQRQAAEDALAEADMLVGDALALDGLPDELAERAEDLAGDVEALREQLAELAELADEAQADAVAELGPGGRAEYDPAAVSVVQLNGGVYEVAGAGDAWATGQALYDDARAPGLSTLAAAGALVVLALYEDSSGGAHIFRVPLDVVRESPEAITTWIQAIADDYDYEFIGVDLDGYEDYEESI